MARTAMSLDVKQKTAIAFAAACGFVVGGGVAFAAVGDLDSTFDGDGVTRSDFDGSSVQDLAIQSDGKIVAVGLGELEDPPTGDERAILGRYTSAGAPDPTFNSGAGVTSLQYNAAPTALSSVAVRPSGPIVTAGQKLVGGVLTPVVAQHLGTGPSAGALDGATFNQPLGLRDVPFAAAEPGSFFDLELVPATGDAIAVGFTTPAGGRTSFAVASVTPAGALESGFGNAGSGLRTARPSNLINGTTAGDDAAFAVAIDPSNSSIVVAGLSDTTNADGGTNDDGDIGVAFLSAAGAIQNVKTIDIDDRDFATDVAIQPDGKVLLAGGLEDNDLTGDNDNHFVARLLSNGNLDPTFGGGDGIVQGGVVGEDFGDWSLALLPDGKIVVVGGTPSFANDWLVARYTANGLPDATFDGDGRRLFDFGADRGALKAVAVQADGKLVVGGQIADDWALGRLAADDPPPVVSPPVTVSPPAAKKKCKKGRKLRKGKCVKKKKKTRK